MLRFFPAGPDTFVEQLAFAEAVFLLDSGLRDGRVDADVAADGRDVGLHLAACCFGGLVEQFDPEIPDARGGEAREQLECRLRLPDEQRVAAFGVALQKVPFSLVVEDFHLVLRADLAAFGEAPAVGERSRERTVFGVECRHVLVQG